MKSKRFLCIIGILIFIEQGIKMLIDRFLMDHNYNIIGEYVQFKPHLNTQYSWINSLLNLGIGRMLHILLVILSLSFIFILHLYIKAKNMNDHIISWLFIFAFSAAICSLIDKVFWGGSLDYISLKGLFIFDLKDLYITISEVILVGMIVFNYKKIRTVSEKEIYRDMKRFIALKIHRILDKNEK